MALSSSPCLALALLALVALTGMASSSCGHVIRATIGGVQLLEDHELLMMERFHGWTVRHGGSYATAEEKLRRFEIYRWNLQFIEAANRDGRLSYTLGENKFTNLTHEELIPGHIHQPPCAAARPRDGGGGGDGDHNSRRTCACWAFAVVAAIERAYTIAKGVEPPELSEQELIDCDLNDSGCQGGWPQDAFDWVQISIKDYGQVKERSEEELMLAVANQLVTVEFDATDECFRHYLYAVYDGMCINEHGDYVGPCSSNTLNHDMAIVEYVGKGDDLDKYWIAKNS
ncbi:hypothetical protein BAE44_0004449 [Dichanthelium oligosanthes]|uniref:Uncharacterized protein n=1 Tax=Dichanthelium oligosanthes TaxID=888268 RepID=A0A1E5WAU5_9POAL|nr:hypothetical protein BAE44_0004449 [Dichanthelium oligosanthes]